MHHGNSANLTTNPTKIAQDNTQQVHERTKGEGPLRKLPLLGMLVAGVALWLVRELWPE
jgi:hypothetical protein